MKKLLLLAAFLLLHIQPISAEEAPPSASQAGVATTTAPAPTPATADPAFADYQSVMFNNKETQEIDKVVQAILNNEALPGDNKEQAPAANVAPDPDVDYFYPQFYLASIVYHRAGEWSIWVNNQRITNGDAEIIKGLKVVSVTPKQAVLSFTFEPTDRSDFTLKPEDERVTLDSYARTATFMLLPNQTFSTYNWKIYEGKVQQVVERGQPKKSLLSELPDIKSVFPNAANNPAAPADSKSSGIKGVINQYQKIDDKPAP